MKRKAFRQRKDPGSKGIIKSTKRAKGSGKAC